MLRFSSVLLIVIAHAAGEQLILRDGSMISGALVEITKDAVTLRRCGRTETFARENVRRIDFEAPAVDRDCEPQSGPDLPAGAELRVLLLDFIDTIHEPPGQTFRGKLAEAVVVNGRVIASKDARLVLRLRASSEPGAQSLEIVGIERADHWVEVVAGRPDAFSVSVKERKDVRQEQPICVRGTHVYIPSNTLLIYRADAPLRLVRAKE
jgi:hypothetical protein